MKKNWIFLILVLVVIVLFVLFDKTRNQIKRVKTLDAMGQIYVSVSRTLGTNSATLEKYNPALETQKIFPSISMMNGQIIDSWGRPITISLKRMDKGFDLRLISSGADGIIDTKDDIMQGYLFPDEPKH